jgi:hypothetical protein
MVLAAKFSIDTTNLKVIDKLRPGIDWDTVWVLKELPDEAFFTIGKVSIDWDGDPKAYGDKKKHPHISPHDDLGNAGGKGVFWGVVTNTGLNSGTPIEQSGVGPAQPYKDYMISKSKLIDSRYPERDIRRWTDATQIPYIALPNSRPAMRRIGLREGCYCLMIELQTMKFCFGVYADSKARKPRMGEISKRAADLLGNKDGEGYVLLIVFPKSGQGQGIIPTEATIQAKARKEFELFSWMDDGDHLVKALVGIVPVGLVLVRAGYHTTLGDLELI